MDKKRLIVALALGIALITGAGAYAQGRQTGTIWGTTFDAQELLAAFKGSSQHVLAGVRVAVR